MSKRGKNEEPNNITNFYKKIPKNLLPKYENPNYDNHLINVPFRMLIVGASGAGKTSVALEIIKRMNNTFGEITIITKNADEPLYKFLRTKIPAHQLHIYEGINQIPDLDSYDPDFQHLVIFDDLVLEKNQSKIEEYFIRGRKIAKGLSMMYLTQSYYKTPKTIRLNVSYLILKKLASNRDLNLILSEVNLGVNKEVLLALYKYTTTERSDFLMIDIDELPEKKFRKNFLEIINLEEE
jgi:uridine kinase